MAAFEITIALTTRRARALAARETTALPTAYRWAPAGNSCSGLRPANRRFASHLATAWFMWLASEFFFPPLSPKDRKEGKIEMSGYALWPASLALSVGCNLSFLSFDRGGGSFSELSETPLLWVFLRGDLSFFPFFPGGGPFAGCQ
jgi:hypothetical protein